MLIVDSREGDPKRVALVREADDSAVQGGMVAAGGGRKGKRAEYRCAACGYGIVVYGQAPSCPMCREARWQHVEWRPFSQLLDFALPVGTRSHRGRLNAPSLPPAEEPIRSAPSFMRRGGGVTRKEQFEARANLAFTPRRLPAG